MKLTICGDVCPAYANDLFVRKDVKTLFNRVPEIWRESNGVLVNLECTLTEGGRAIEKFGPNLKASPVCAEVLADIGVTACAISNNHIFDLGEEGVRDTLRALNRAGLAWTGFGEDYEDARTELIFDEDGDTAIIAVCEHEYCYALEDRMGARPFHVYDTMADIRRAKRDHEHVIVLYHGGKEQSVYPSPRLRRLCQEMVDNGADLVTCQHSHCIGCQEVYHGGHIVYGQGNFHFVNMFPDHPHWQNGLILQVELGETLSVEYVPVVVRNHGIDLAEGAEKQSILDGFAARSADLQTDVWLEDWRQFCRDSRPVYENAIKYACTDQSTDRQNELFAHYLYCEAHRDVLEELFKLSWETRAEP